MCRSHSSPTACNWHKHFRLLFHKRRLLLRCQHQIAVALILRGKGGEDFSANTEIGSAHMRPFFCAFKAQCNAAKVCGFHVFELMSSSVPRMRSLSLAACAASRLVPGRTYLWRAWLGQSCAWSFAPGIGDRLAELKCS